MTTSTDSERTNISDRASDQNQVADSESIADSVEQPVGDVDSVTLYMHADAAVTVEVELSPDGGQNWYTMSEGPIEFTEKGDETVHIDYNTSRIRLTGTTNAAVTVQAREVT